VVQDTRWNGKEGFTLGDQRAAKVIPISTRLGEVVVYAAYGGEWAGDVNINGRGEAVTLGRGELKGYVIVRY